MAFDPSKYKVSTGERYMPVVLLLDVSGSMDGDKINNLYTATVKMIETFADEGKKEIPYKIAIITFGESVEYHTPYTDAKDLVNNLRPFQADGQTPLGTALCMAKDLIEDKNETKSKWYRPAVVLVSDGKPNVGDWKVALKDFISTGRTERCQRLSMGIGSNAEVDYNVLRDFASEDTENISGTGKFCFKAEDAADIIKAFKLISSSISQTASKNKGNFPNIPSAFKKKVVSNDDDYI